MDEVIVFKDYGDLMGAKNKKDTTVQIILSIAIGLSAFLAFCFLRPRWPGLYAARKKHKDEASPLPELPHSFLGWIPVVWRITEQQVLASAGLDAFVFLRSFKLAIKFLTVTAFFALVVIKPVHDRFIIPDSPKHDDSEIEVNNLWGMNSDLMKEYQNGTLRAAIQKDIRSNYLWMYIIFAYVFTGLALYLIVTETRRIIDIRQEYLGSQSTITDRTIRLSGIPKEVRSEERIKEFVEELEIGKVESVTLCRNWKELDETMAERMNILRRLEEAWTVHTGRRQVERNLESLPISQPSPPGPLVNLDAQDHNENSGLLGNGDQAHVTPYAQQRPKTKIRYGRFRLQSIVVDAIDYYEEKLHKLDDKIKELREKEFEPTALAFVTMDSVAACQMAVQAVLDPSPQVFLARPSPAPADVVWPNTYLSRTSRTTRAWSITAVVVLLTVFWAVVLAPLATLLNVKNIENIWPQLGKALDKHPIAESFVSTQLPTLLISLLVLLVPYLYDWLANLQGMTSQGDVELSVVSKNFFFTFFNFFVVFTVLGTLSKFLYGNFDEPLKDVNNIAYRLATKLAELLNFYLNYILLQGLGLFPLRLLEFGSVALYPISLIGAKTPRDYAELVQPPVFSYGFYLPQTLLIFIICIVYSVLPNSWQILLAGLAYFTIGHMVYKYQLLYAMDHRQHSTGKGWTMICDRIIVGVILFQLTTTGELALKGAPKLSPLILPLLAGTLYFSFVYGRTYKPLMSFIALRSIRRAEHYDLADGLREHAGINGSSIRYFTESAGGRTVDESRETGQRFINPSLIAPLEDVWIVDKAARQEDGRGHTTNPMHDADV